MKKKTNVKRQITTKLSALLVPTMKYQGKIWKVLDRTCDATFTCNGTVDSPTASAYPVLKRLPIAELLKEERKLRNKYKKVELRTAHDIVHLWRESVNDGNIDKMPERDFLQRMYIIGKGWNKINPMDEAAAVEDSKVIIPVSEKAKTFVSKYWAIGIAALIGIAAIIWAFLHKKGMM